MHALPPPPTGKGGEGGFAPSLPSFTRVGTSDARMIGRAVAGRWPMCREQREKVVETLMVIVEHPNRFDVRTVVAASTALMAADKINLEDEKAVAKTPDVVIELADDGTERKRVDFSRMTDAEIDLFIEQGGKV